MATISENLQTIKTSTDNIKQAIIHKGGEISGDITTWADAISAIESGGITLLGGIKNKLNGAEIVIPTGVVDGDVLYTYEYGTSLKSPVTMQGRLESRISIATMLACPARTIIPRV